MQVSNLRVFIVIFFSGVLALGSMAPCAWSKGKNPSRLYNVEVGGSVERGVIVKVVPATKTLVFDASSFKRKFKKLAVLLVIDEGERGVLAELVVRKVATERRQVTAKVLRMAPRTNLRDLQGRTIVRLEDVASIASQSAKGRTNPMLQLGAGFFSRTAAAANVMTGARIDPLVTGYSVHAELFPPPTSSSGWLNWVGLRGKFEQLSAVTFESRAARSEATQQASMQGQSSQAEVVVRPWTAESWLHQVTLSYSFLHQYSEQVEFAANELAPQGALLKLQRQHASWAAGVTLNPFGDVFLGLSYTAAAPTEFTLTDSSVPEQSYTGQWSTSATQASLHLVHSFADAWRFSMVLSLERRVDDIGDFSEVSLPEFKAVDLAPSLVLGIGFHG